MPQPTAASPSAALVAIPTIIPMSLLEALRNLDTPVEDGLEELAGEIVNKRLGLSQTVAAQIARSAGPKPRLYQCCGTEDFLYDQNLRFRDHALALGLDLTYEEGPGEHEWGYWDRMIQHVLAWLPLKIG